MKTKIKKLLNLNKFKLLIFKTSYKFKTKVSLEEKIKTYAGKNLAKDFEWNDNKGKEIW